VPAVLLLTACLSWPAYGVAPVPASASPPDPPGVVDVPPVLAGETWLRHHREDLLPYWDLPAAYGTPPGNFPSFRGRAGEVLTASPNRGVSTLGRGVYGYSLSFMLTGDERYLTLARAGLDWIEEHAEDADGLYFGTLTDKGAQAGNTLPVRNRRDLFDLASIGLGYAAYFSATRDPEAEAKLLEIRDLIFDRYYVPANDADSTTPRMRDALRLGSEVDLMVDGGDITNWLVPATGIFLPSHALLTDPARRDQFRDDLRKLTDGLIARHKNDPAAANPWMFWGRTLLRGDYDAPQTDFGHTLKSYQMIHNANQVFADRPWNGLADDRTAMLERAWDDEASRWNLKLLAPDGVAVEPDSGWWVHDEADQLLAAMDLADGYANADRLARSTQTFLDIYVDRDPAYPVRETFSRVAREGLEGDDRKSFFGKNMYHNFEHAMVLYLHGQQMAGLPARLHYAFPQEQALTTVAKPYWFDATGELRTDAGPSAVLPGHELVTVDFTGIGQVPLPPGPTPEDTAPPVTTATVTPTPTVAGWNNGDTTVTLAAVDDVVGVKEIHVRIDDLSGATPTVASIHPGGEVTLPAFTGEGDYDITFFAVDRLGKAEPAQVLTVRIDRTAPTVAGLPEQPCVLWPPNGRLVPIADVTGADTTSGVDAVSVLVSVNQRVHRDVVILDGRVWVRAEREGGRDRVYTVSGTVTDLAGNATTESGSCVVPRRSP
jgi:mannose/cellobiose epimerase-like protein (N-acyl-D-glucosamine 2-epimerase family)